MSSGDEKRAASFRDLVEEAKKRIIVLVICIVGLSYLMSLTSPSVLVNLPAALLLIIVLRYMSLELETRRKAATYKGKATTSANSSERRLFATSIDRSEWKNKVNSTVVEEAIEQFNKHIVSEWVTDLWYSRITPDRQGPEELVLIMNGVLGEISSRFRNVNLIDLLTRDIINLLCVHLELFRECKTKIERQQSKLLTDEERDIELKSVLAAQNKLHPILFSGEAEHKVLQDIIDGLILLTFKKEDLQCSLFRYIVRELLACVVIRPVLNLVNPRFINERIEALVISSAEKKTEGSKAATIKVTTHANRINAPLSILSDDISQSSPDPSMKGVELVHIKKDESPKDPLLAMATRSTRSWNSLPEAHNGDGRNGNGIERHHSGGEWGDMLDVFSRRKTEALAPENFDNMWAKGKDYKTNQPANPPVLQVHNSSLAGGLSGNSQERKNVSNSSGYSKAAAMQGKTPMSLLNKAGDELTSENSDEGEESWSSSSSFNVDDEDTSSVTGLDTPGVKVWDGRTKRNFSRIHHPLETFDGKKKMRKGGNLHPNKGLHRTNSAKKRSRSSAIHNSEHVWQEVQRTSFLLGDGQDLLNSSKPGDLSEDSEVETLGGRTYSGATTTASSMSFASLPETVAASSAKRSIISDSYFTLRCEVFGANIVKSGSKTFAVYCICVTDVNNKNWSIKRRFQHFEELHRRLKEFPEYNLHLPPKHFLSTGPDKFIIQERCKLLDQYLKKLLQLPTVSCSIEVWDFLSVDSQMYIFSNSLSIIETLSVDTPDTVREKSKEYWENPGNNLSNGTAARDSVSLMKGDHHLAYGSRLKAKDQSLSSSNKLENESIKEQKNVNSSGNLDRTVKIEKQASFHSVETTNDTTSDSTLPSEWIPPNLSVPILDLVDVILQLKDGGWIRRKAFWVAKQVLQLGMGDAFDDWLIEKIQLLRQGSVVASGVRRLEQILWPDGIFITKHPRRQQPSSPVASPSSNSPYSSPKADENDVQLMEAKRRAKFVYELMIDKAPAAIVGLVGSKEYEQCAKDLYYFIQSSVCMKLLTFDILKLLLLSAFPELERVFRQLEEEKEKFGKLELS